MPRVPLYSGPIASAVMPNSFVPRDTGLFAQERGGSVGADTGELLRRVFLGNQPNPERELAGKYKAEADAKRYELEQTRNADAQRTKLGGVMDELMYRGGMGPNAGAPQKLPIVEEAPYERQQIDPAAPQVSDSERMRSIAADQIRKAIANGADSKETTAIMQAFMLSVGDDNEIVRTNSALEGKYLGDNQSPSLAAQKDKIEDEQKQEIEKQDLIERTKKYGFDVQSADRRYDTDVDARTSITNNAMDNATSRANNASTQATTRRGQDLTDARSKKDTEGYRTVVEEYPAVGGRPAKSKLFGLFGEERPATPARPKTKVTTKVPVKAKPGVGTAQKADPLGIR